MALADRFVDALATQESVPRELVGELYFPFVQLLIEAEYVNEPDPLLNLAWNYQERLDQIFGLPREPR